MREHRRWGRGRAGSGGGNLVVVDVDVHVLHRGVRRGPPQHTRGFPLRDVQFLPRLLRLPLPHSHELRAALALGDASCVACLCGLERRGVRLHEVGEGHDVPVRMPVRAELQAAHARGAQVETERRDGAV